MWSAANAYGPNDIITAQGYHANSTLTIIGHIGIRARRVNRDTIGVYASDYIRADSITGRVKNKNRAVGRVSTVH